jgi:hypothetical protein
MAILLNLLSRAREIISTRFRSREFLDKNTCEVKIASNIYVRCLVIQLFVPHTMVSLQI